jgi:hypothetical protein
MAQAFFVTFFSAKKVRQTNSKNKTSSNKPPNPKRTQRTKKK